MGFGTFRGKKSPSTAGSRGCPNSPQCDPKWRHWHRRHSDWSIDTRELIPAPTNHHGSVKLLELRKVSCFRRHRRGRGTERGTDRRRSSPRRSWRSFGEEATPENEVKPPRIFFSQLFRNHRKVRNSLFASANISHPSSLTFLLSANRHLASVIKEKLMTRLHFFLYIFCYGLPVAT